MDLLAAEMMAKTGRDPGELYRELTRELGEPVYERIDAPATPSQKAILSKLSPDQVQGTELAGDRIVAKLTTAPGNGASIGGLKVVTDQGWFAARPSGTEDVYKLYAESFKGKDHLKRIQEEAQELISNVLAKQLQRGVGYFEAGLRAIHFACNGVFERRRLGGCVIHHRRPRERPAGLDFRKHVEEMFLHQLMFTDRLAALPPRFGIGQRLFIGRPGDPGKDRSHQPVGQHECQIREWFRTRLHRRTDTVSECGHS